VWGLVFVMALQLQGLGGVCKLDVHEAFQVSPTLVVGPKNNSWRYHHRPAPPHHMFTCCESAPFDVPSSEIVAARAPGARTAT
jgi:hypothetical protein